MDMPRHDHSHHDHEHHRQPANGRAPAHPAPAVTTYTCPMHPEIQQAGPGSCPKCGMTLVPLLPAKAATEYTCPMHPEVRSPEPGNCPKCGMTLVPVAGTKEDDSELRNMARRFWVRSEEHTSELQSPCNLVCRLLLEKKNSALD